MNNCLPHCIPVLLLLTGVSFCQIDSNGNLLSDLWEERFQPIASPLGMDHDADGLSTAEEAVTGTDPNSAASNFVLEREDQSVGQTTQYRVGWDSVAGKAYHVHISEPDAANGFQQTVGPILGSGGPMHFLLTPDSCVVGGVHAEIWTNLPPDVSTPADLRTTLEPPHVVVGLNQLSLDNLQMELAAVRIKCQFRSKNPTGFARFFVASRGAAELYLNPNGTDPSGLQRNASSLNPAPSPGAFVTLTEQERVALELVYLRGEGTPLLQTSLQPLGVNFYQPQGDELISHAEEAQPAALNAATLFLHLSTSDIDSDDDGVNDWEERELGLNMANPATFGVPDMDVATQLPQQILRLVPKNPTTMIEELGGTTLFIVERLAGTGALTVPVALEGVDASDLKLSAPMVSFAPGQTEASLRVSPVSDLRLEPLEVANIRLMPRPDTMILGDDKWLAVIEDEVDPQPLLYATRYIRENGPTDAWGYATLLLSADRRSAMVSSQFYNLTTPQSASHIHRGAIGVSGPVVTGLPGGQFSDHSWILAAPVDMNMPGMIVADADLQRDLDDLQNGRLYANIHSSENPGGEIRGNFVPADGVFDFVAPDDLPQVAGGPNPPDVDAFRFLEQASFGPSPTSMTDVTTLGFTAWIDQQMDSAQTPLSSFSEFVQAANDFDAAGSGKTFAEALGDHRRNLRASFWLSSIHGKDQLRQRVAFALSEIFVISDRSANLVNRTYATADYWDMLAGHAFGNYRDLLGDVSRHPVMGIYLSHLRNEKEDLEAGTKPDENYAREIMQLFSIGLFQMHPDGTLRLDQYGQLIPTYDNEDITELAKVFTGMSHGRRYDTADQLNPNFYYTGGSLTNQLAWTEPMAMFDAFHDVEEKTIVGGNVLPENQTGDQDLSQALDVLFNHANTPAFIGRLLIQRLVTSNPSPGYVYRVAQAFEDNGAGVRGDLGAVVRAILLDQEARLPSFYEDAGFGKLKEPVVRFAAVYRALGVTNNIPVAPLSAHGLSMAAYEPGAIRLMLASSTSDVNLGQTAQYAPSVFNFFLPDFVPEGRLAAAQLVGPEFQIATDSRLIYQINWFNNQAWQTAGAGLNLGTIVNYDAADENLFFTTELDSLEVEDLIDLLDVRLLGGRMTPTMRATLLADLPAITFRRAQAAVHYITNSPLFVTQR